MPYIGNTIRAADDYRLIDDISSSFNGSTTSFALQVAGSSPVPFPKSPQQVLISVNGVIQEPDPSGSSGFNLVGTNIVFSSAPTNGHAFFGIIYATADYLNAGGNFPAGSLGAPSITFIGDENTGLYRKGGGSIGFVADATEIANTDSNGLTISSGNLIIPDSIIHSGDTNTKIRFPAADIIAVETAGSERVRVDSSGQVGIGVTPDTWSTGAGITVGTSQGTLWGSGDQINLSGNAYFNSGWKAAASKAGASQIEQALGNIDFKVSGSVTADSAITFTNAMRIDSSGKVGIGTTSPQTSLHITDAEANIRLSSDANGLSQIQFGDANDTIRGNIVYRNGSGGDALCFNGYNNTERMRIDSSGRLLLGTSASAIVGGGGASLYQIETTSQNAISCVAHRGTGNASGSILILGKSRGTAAGAVTSVGINDELGSLRFAGADDTDLQSRGGEISCEVDGTPGSNDMPGRLLFKTTADGAASPTEHMRIDSSGRVAIQGSPTRALLEVRASGGNNTMLTAVFGADEGTTAGTLTDNADKGGRVGLQHYDIDEEPFGLFSYGASNGTNALNFGGGTSLMNAATHMGFYTASNSTTTGGTERIRIDSSGRVGIGTSSPAKLLDIYKSGTNQSDMYVRNATVNYKVQTMSDQAQAGTETNHPFYVVSNNQYVARFDGDGIKFGSDTAAANALDDYEEGQYQPTPTGDSGQTSVSIHGSENTLNYTKIGNLVTVHGRIRLNAVSYSGGLVISLPFTAASHTNTSNAQMTAVGTHGADFDSSAGTGSHIGMFLETGGSSALAYFVVTRDNTSWIGANNSIIVSGTYLTFVHTYRAA